MRKVATEAEQLRSYVAGMEAGLAHLAAEAWGEKAPLYEDALQYIAGKTTEEFRLAMTRRGRFSSRGQGLSRDEILAHIRDGNIEEARDKLKTLFDTSVL